MFLMHAHDTLPYKMEEGVAYPAVPPPPLPRCKAAMSPLMSKVNMWIYDAYAKVVYGTVASHSPAAAHGATSGSQPRDPCALGLPLCSVIRT